MAGIGVELDKIYEKNTITTYIFGFFYNTIAAAAPMLTVIGVIFLMKWQIGFSNISYAEQELFSCTILYIFVFALLVTSVFNSVFSRYVSDMIFEEKYDEIYPCYIVGLLMNMVLGAVPGIVFCAHEYAVGKVPLYYVFMGFCGYIALIMTFYTMLYLSICKDYKKISLYFFFGMAAAYLLMMGVYYFVRLGGGDSMLLGLAAGFLITASLEAAAVKRYFRQNSRHYQPVFQYCKLYWKLILTNFLYTLGLFIHNFVFWNSSVRSVLSDSFVYAPVYDLATCIAMFTNITASVFFIGRVELNFHDYYKAYSEAVIGGRGRDIQNAKKRMFRQVSAELLSLTRLQFIVSVVVFLAAEIFLPQFGFSGLVMKIYPCLAAGYFILFTMYAAILFLYYMNDLTGSVITALCFCITVFAVSIFAAQLPPSFYGMGVVAGSLAGWTIAYFRLRNLETTLDYHTFCRGTILKKGEGSRPPSMVYGAEKMTGIRGKEDD